MVETSLEVFSSNHFRVGFTFTQCPPAETVYPDWPTEQTGTAGSDAAGSDAAGSDAAGSDAAGRVELIARFFLLQPPVTASETLGSIVQFVFGPRSPKKLYSPTEVIVNKLLSYPPMFKL